MTPLQPDERIVVEVRKHWLSIVVHAVILFIIAVVFSAVMPFALQMLFRQVPSMFAVLDIQRTVLFCEVLWLWFVWCMFFVMWTNYYLDVLVITNKRLIDMEQFVLFRRDEVIVPLEQIEDMKVEVTGILATVFGYGNLQIQTAGAARETMIKNIMRPEIAHAKITHAKESLIHEA